MEKNAIFLDFSSGPNQYFFFENSFIKVVSGDIYIPNNIIKQIFAKIFSLGGRNDRRAQCAPPQSE